MKWTLGLVTVLTPLISLAQGAWPKMNCKPSPVPLFQSSDVLALTFKGNFPVSSATEPFEMTYVDPSTKSEKSMPTQATRRGKSRGAMCPFKPIRLIWSKSEKEAAKETHFEGLKGQDMKLTTHCSYTSGQVADHLEENEVVIKEYLIYRILKAFELPVFDVRLAKIQYTTTSGTPTVEGMGFFIESSSQFEKRCGLLHAKKEEVAPAMDSSVNKQIYVPYLFSRLIADARDYIDNAGHNSEIFFDANKAAQLLVPYDFNDSGQVNSGVAPFWTFTSDMLSWFNLLRQGPFSREGMALFELTPEEQAEWKKNVVEMAQQLLLKRDAVFAEIDRAPLQESSKTAFREYIGKHLKQFQRIVDDQATADPKMAKPSSY